MSHSHNRSRADFANKTILMMAGGTGGHVYPALAVANYLSEQGAIIHWLGNKTGFEGQKVTDNGYTLHDINVRGLRGNGALGWVKAPYMVSKAIWRAKQVMADIAPDLVIGMGGFAAGPGGVAAKLSGTPLVIHEQNAVMGMTNKLLSKMADSILLADKRAAKALKSGASYRVVGNPVRQDIGQLPPVEERFKQQVQRPTLLVIGGSQGAQAINDCVPEALALLDAPQRPHVVHQTGQKTFAQTLERYQQFSIEAQVVAYIDDMASAYAACDWVLARSGALSVAEIATVGIGAVFVPFPHAVDDHQTANAQSLVDAGAATIIAQDQLTPQTLADAIKANNDADYRRQRALNARELSHASALGNIIQELEKYI